MAATTKKIDPSRRLLGHVKWFNPRKGFGFIAPLPGEPIERDAFVYQKSILMAGFRRLEAGQLVQFEVTANEKGFEASKVNVITPGRARAQLQAAGRMMDYESILVANGAPIGGRRTKLIKCFNCGKFGHHIASRCRVDVSQISGGSGGGGFHFEGGVGTKFIKRCHRCRSEKHLLVNCPLWLKENAEGEEEEEEEVGEADEESDNDGLAGGGGGGGYRQFGKGGRRWRKANVISTVF